MDERLAVIPRGFRSVVFDCDSTLAAIEGIDELAGGYASEIRVLTDAAMEGSITLDEVYAKRLAIIQPTRDEVEALTRLYIERLVEDARQTVAALLWIGKDVRVISGGLFPAVGGLATELGIPPHAVAAVRIDFDGAGRYSGFDERSPLTRNGGKAIVVRDWSLSRPSLMVGDGSTDLEARPEVDAFAAYMGVAYRELVAAGADVVLRAPSLSPVLALAADENDRRRLAASDWAALLAKGETLLEEVGSPG